MESFVTFILEDHMMAAILNNEKAKKSALPDFIMEVSSQAGYCNAFLSVKNRNICFNRNEDRALVRAFPFNDTSWRGVCASLHPCLLHLFHY